MSIALSSPGWGEFPVAGFEVLAHLLFEHLLEDGLNSLASTTSFTSCSNSCFFGVKCLLPHPTHKLSDTIAWSGVAL